MISPKVYRTFLGLVGNEVTKTKKGEMHKIMVMTKKKVLGSECGSNHNFKIENRCGAHHWQNQMVTRAMPPM